MDNESKNSVYPGCKAMTLHDRDVMHNLNVKNHYGLSYNQLVRLVSAHRYARKHDDIRRMEMIEYRLTDINFHHECFMINNGLYDELYDEIRNERRGV